MPNVGKYITFPIVDSKLKSKLNAKSSVQNLDEYVSSKVPKKDEKQDVWSFFLDAARKAEKKDAPEEDNSTGRKMRFYRMMSKEEAVQSYKQKELLPNSTKGAEQWVTMSLKHSRNFTATNTAQPKEAFYFRYTVDIQGLAENDAFDPYNFIAYTSAKEKQFAKNINEQRVLEKKSRLGVFETQKLGDHEFAKVNIGLWPDMVDVFNKYMVKEENAIMKLKIEDGIQKLKRITPKDLYLNEPPSSSSETERSETSK